MANSVTRFLLFLSSYFPLALIFFVLFIGERPGIALGILGIGLAGVAGLALYLTKARRLASLQLVVAGVQRRDPEAMSYIVSYVIPFLAIPFSGWAQGFALGVFFLMLGVLYVNSNMIHINPTLNLAGFHLYEITLEDESVQSLLARRRVAKGDHLNVVKLGDGILFEVGR